MRFGKEETSTEDKKPCLQGFVPSWSFLTRLRRPYLFRQDGKDRGEKGRLVTIGCMLHLNSGRSHCFGLAFHTRLTLRASWYAPPDTLGIRFVTGYRRISAVNRRFSRNFDRCYLLAGKLVGAGLCSARWYGFGWKHGRSRALPPTACTPVASPMRGSCRRRRLMRWTAPRRSKCPHLIRHGSAVPPSPHRGRQGVGWLLTAFPVPAGPELWWAGPRC